MKSSSTIKATIRPFLTILTLGLLFGLVTACASPSAGDAESAATAPAPVEGTAADAPATPAPEAAAPAAATPAAESGEERSTSDMTPAQRNEMYDAPPAMTIDSEKHYYATLKTEKGDIEVQLFADRAPITVNNFVFLARDGFYDDTTFHRVIDGFMAQAGDPTGTGSGGPGYLFEDEIHPGLEFDQSGLLAMANRGPGTNGSQFFITFAPTDWLNGGHTIFGKVIAGEDVLGQLTRRDPAQQPDFPGDKLITVEIEESDESVLPTPTAMPPTPTPTATPTPFAPSELSADDRPLADLPPEERVNYFNTPPEMSIDTAKQYSATINTSKGALVVDLFVDAAPTGVNNFVTLVELGFYDNTPISLVRPGDSIIFGVPDNNPLNDAGYKFASEVGADFQTSMGALTYIPFEQLPDGTILSSSSQVLIALIEPPIELNSRFSFFGQIAEGFEVLDQLTTDDTIESIQISSSE